MSANREATQSKASESWPIRIGIYLFHLLLATIEVFIVGALLSLILERVFSVHAADAVFAGPVYFGEIGLALIAGFLVNGELRSKSAMWIWVLPAIWLIAWIPDAFKDLYGPRGWGLVFGTKCGADCLDQLVTVCPFYSSIAYSLGSWAGRFQ